MRFRGCVFTLLMLLAQAVSADQLPCVPTADLIPATYRAADGRRIEACFNRAQERVALRLPDALLVELPAAVSGSGARYSDGQRTFWEHQGVGRYFVNEQLQFEGKLEEQHAYGGGVSSKLIKRDTRTAGGEKIRYPTTDTPEVTAMLVEIAPGAETGWHKHRYPVYAYMLDGELEVKMEQKAPLRYRTGDAIIEVVEQYHNGRSIGSRPVRLVVFYTGAKGQPPADRRP